jgi:hypothetical protein
MEGNDARLYSGFVSGMKAKVGMEEPLVEAY